MTRNRWPLLVFIVAVVAAFPLYLWLGRDQWFFLDDWDLLANRSARSFDDLLRPHNEHWMTLPILVYRALWYFFGIRSYLPYQVISITLHLAAASLLWVVMRRAGIRPWIGTAAAVLFVFLGSGRANILWSFQINFVGSLVAGLAHLVLADHDGPRSRRDAIGLVFGAIGLLCSGLAITMTAVVGVAVALRRGVRAAAWHTVPLGAVFIAWWLVYGRAAYHEPLPGVADGFRFVWNAGAGTFAHLGQFAFVGLALFALAVTGVVASVRPPRRELHRQLAAPVALCAGLLLFASTTALARWRLPLSQGAQSGRYTHVMAAMAIPIVAVGADVIASRWRRALPVLIAALLFGIPANVRAAELHGRDRIALGSAGSILALAQSPAASVVPASVEPLPDGAPFLTIGWLLSGVRQGRVPQPSLTATERANATFRLSVHPSKGAVGGTCKPLTGTVERSLSDRETLSFRGGDIDAQLVPAAGDPSSFVTYGEASGARLEVLVGPLTLRLRAASGATGVELCD